MLLTASFGITGPILRHSKLFPMVSSGSLRVCMSMNNLALRGSQSKSFIWTKGQVALLDPFEIGNSAISSFTALGYMTSLAQLSWLSYRFLFPYTCPFINSDSDQQFFKEREPRFLLYFEISTYYGGMVDSFRTDFELWLSCRCEIRQTPNYARYAGRMNNRVSARFRGGASSLQAGVERPGATAFES